MAVFRLAPDELQRREARDAARRKAEIDREARAAEKLERELDALEASLRVDPPPELSPRERKEREMVERLERLEGKEIPPIPTLVNTSDWTKRHRLMDALRVRSIERDRKEKEAREAADGTARKRDKYDAARRAIEAAHNERIRKAEETCVRVRDASRERRDGELTALGVRP